MVLEPARRVGIGSALGIILAVTAWVVIQLVVVDLGSEPSHDEATYLSQVTPGVEPLGWSAPRARGITYLVSPLVRAGLSLHGVRVGMVAVHAILLLFAAFVWRRKIGAAAAWGTALFATSWLTIFYGSRVMPNLSSALIILIAIGLWTSTTPRSLARIVGVPFAFFAAGLARPVDASFALVAIGLVVAGSRRSRDLVSACVLALSGLAAWIPWAIEAVTRFGGVAERFGAASTNVGGGFHPTFGAHLSILDGPILWPEPDPRLDPLAIAWVGVLIVGAIAAAALQHRHRSAASLCLAAGVSLALPYLLLQSAPKAIAPRFLIPAYALLAVGAGLAIASFVRRFVGARVVGLGLVAALAAVQVPIARETVAAESVRGEVAVALAHLVAQRADHRGCAFLTDFLETSISLLSGCAGRRIDNEGAAAWLLERRDLGMEVTVLISKPPRPRPPFTDWVVSIYRGPRGHVYLYDEPGVSPRHPPGTISPLLEGEPDGAAARRVG